MTQLKAGDMAPDFKSTTQDGAALTLAGLYLMGYCVLYQPVVKYKNRP